MDMFVGFGEFVKVFFEWVLWVVVVGVVFLTTAFFLDLLYFQKRRQFKEAFGLPLSRTTPEQVNSLILSKYERLSAMKNKVNKLSSAMEKDLLQAQVEVEWEKIRAMERAALVNGFTLSKESRFALDRVNELVVRYAAPAA